MMSQPERRTINAAPMGAEGSAFIGLAPFVDTEHFLQNVGDGTFFHSASQSVRACVAAGVNITFKLLYNGHVAMTGGQHATGATDVPTLTRFLESEGVRRTIVVSEASDRWQAARLASNAKLFPRERYEDAVRELRDTPGVTVLVFDQECAAEKRRARKRGKQPQPTKFIFINEEVCEGCGDCGDISNCMSVQPIETEFGRKTQIHQSSCNKDYSCSRGDCPSFLTVISEGGVVRKPVPELSLDRLPEPASKPSLPADGYRVYMPGIGGTGVVTTNQVLAVAAMLGGKAVHALDQTGLAQKGGAVLSSLVILPGQQDPYRSNRVGVAGADLMLGLDALGVVAPLNADRMAPGRTLVVADSSLQPTAETVRHVDILLPGKSALERAIDQWSQSERNVWIDAGKTAEALFGDQMLTNTFMLGVAYQSGALPVAFVDLEEAIRLNGVAVDRNLQAFRYGRLYRHDPAAVRRALSTPPLRYEEVRKQYLKQLGDQGGAYQEMLADAGGAGLCEDLRTALAHRLGELVGYQDVAYARRYLARVLAVHAAEQQVLPGHEELATQAVRHLYKLMAYKDEYEVARLLLKQEWELRVKETFDKPKVRYNLHPPFLRDRGLKRKLELGGWFRPFLRTLIPLRRVRGTAWDPFARSEIRRLERALISWYEELLDDICANLTPANHGTAVQLAATPDRIRGYEQIKQRNADLVRNHVERKRGELQEVAATA